MSVTINKSLGAVSAPSKPRYALKIADQTYVHVARKPNAWLRFWQRVLLGWSWSELVE